MSKLSILIFLLGNVSALFSQIQVTTDVVGGLKATFTLHKNQLNGNYKSFYLNGKKRAEGQFKNNLRHGQWTVWDSTGAIIHQRSYSSPFSFERTYPEIPKNDLIHFINHPPYTPTYNEENFLNYYDVQLGEICMEQVIRRYLPLKENPFLDALPQLLEKLRKEKELILTSDYFTEKEIDSLAHKIDYSKYKITGFKIKEVFFYDTNRFVSESRIVAICPVAFLRSSKEQVELSWIYMPPLRKHLAKEKVYSKKLSKKIKSLDDLLFYRFFSGQIYDNTNIWDTNKPKTKQPISKKEAFGIEAKVIEMEHQCWVRLNW